VKRIFGMVLVTLMIIFLIIPAKAQMQKPHFNFLLGTSAFNVELSGLSGTFISPMAGLELLYPYKTLEWGVTIKGYFVNEITLGFVPMVKFNLGKLYLKLGLGSDITYLFQSGRAVFRKNGADIKEELWVQPRMGGKIFNTGFFCVGVPVFGKSSIQIEAGFEWREFTQQWRINDEVRLYRNSDAVGLVFRVVY